MSRTQASNGKGGNTAKSCGLMGTPAIISCSKDCREERDANEERPPWQKGDCLAAAVGSEMFKLVRDVRCVLRALQNEPSVAVIFVQERSNDCSCGRLRISNHFRCGGSML